MPDNTLEGSADLQDASTMPGDVVAHGFVVNNSNSTKTFVWDRVAVDVPTPWASAICDLNNCYLPFVSTKEFELEAGEEGTMDVHIYPGGNPGVLNGATPGVGTVTIRIYELDNPTNEEFGTFTFTITDGVSSVTYIEHEKIEIYPNPELNAFQLLSLIHI